jgi:4-amino-4-deoxy-L-arabinose transferase-like glycosyltransferase
LAINIEHLSRRASLLIVGLFALVAGLAGIGLPPLDRDEARFAQATAQMLESGDFIAIRFQDEERNKKPAGIHWLQAASVSVFSEVEAREIWAYRLPSLLAALIAALGTYLIGLRLFDNMTGLLAGLIIAAAPGFIAEATIAKTDAALLACVVLAQLALAYLFTDALANRTPRRRDAFLFWLAFGASVLIKGPVGPFILCLTLTVLILTHRRLPWRKMIRPASGVAMLCLIVAPWAIAIWHATEGRFFADALGGDMFGKVGAAQESHGGPPGYHLAFVWLLLWPAIAVLPSAITAAWADRRKSDIIFLLAWALPAWIVFELTATKLPHYTLPLYPALALLAARFVTSVRTNENFATPPQQLLRISAIAYSGASLVIAGGIAALPIVLSNASLTSTTTLGACIIFGAAVAISILLWRRRLVRGVLSAAALSAMTMWFVGAGVLPNITALQVSSRLAEMIENDRPGEIRNGAAPSIISGFYEPSAVFLLGTETQLLAGGAAARRALAQPSAAIAVEARELEAFQAALGDHAAQLIEIGRVEGLNYSNGRAVTLTVYRLGAAKTGE